MSNHSSNKAKKSGAVNEFEISNNGGNNPESSSQNTKNEFDHYLVNPEKFDNLITSIYNLSVKVQAAIDEMKRSNENQEKSLSILTKLIEKYVPKESQ